jgi:hypothetical protein
LDTCRVAKNLSITSGVISVNRRFATEHVHATSPFPFAPRPQGLRAFKRCKKGIGGFIQPGRFNDRLLPSVTEPIIDRREHVLVVIEPDETDFCNPQLQIIQASWPKRGVFMRPHKELRFKLGPSDFCCPLF